MAAKKSRKPKKSSPAPAPAPTKLNLVALKPQNKEPETQQEPVQERVESPTPVVQPIEQTAAPIPTPKEPLSTTPAQPASDEPAQEEPIPNSNAIFQAIGIIVATVNFDDNNRCFVIIGEKQYPLFYTFNHKNAYGALKKEIETTGTQQQRLIVYPKVVHFPSKEQPYQLGFQIVGFDIPTRNSRIAKELDDFQFKLSGLWQFIPVCPTPCVSVFKNFSSERLAYIKQATPQQKVQFLKPSHVPVVWKNAPIKPFRFNPKLEKQEQGNASFVEIITQFLPEKDIFAFTELRSQPSQTAPHFLKAGKKDKAQALQARKKQQN